MIDSARMAAVDRNAVALGVAESKLMESAGNAVAGAVRDLAEPGASVTVVAGRGNNGGDAFVAARYLDDYEVEVILLGRPESIGSEVASENWDALQGADIETVTVPDSTGFALSDPDVVIDGLLGTGVTGAPREPERTAIEHINESSAGVVAVDVPSGMDVDTGEVADVAVHADRVVTFHDLKPGLEARNDVVVADIGIPAAAERFVGPGDLLQIERSPDSHKGDSGRVMVVGGGPYTGAPALAAQAALRAGADLAYLAVPESIADEVQGFSEDLIVEPLIGTRLVREHVEELLDRAEERDVVILGPGLGDASDTMDAVKRFLGSFDGRAVVDADALQVVPDVETGATLVCTPHRGEFRDMGGTDDEDWQVRSRGVAEFADALGHTLLVKGPYDVIANGTTTRVNRTGNPGMTVGGTGDVLAGATGALLATLDPVDAAAVGAYATGRAGDIVVEASGYGMLASDLLAALPRAMRGEDR